MIHVLATIEVVPGEREKFLRELWANVPNVVAEEGCVEYSPAIDIQTDIPRQIAHRDDMVKVVERWESLAALHKHLVAPHMLNYRERVKGLVHHVTLEILQTAPGG